MTDGHSTACANDGASQRVGTIDRGGMAEAGGREPAHGPAQTKHPTAAPRADPPPDPPARPARARPAPPDRAVMPSYQISPVFGLLTEAPTRLVPLYAVLAVFHQALSGKPVGSCVC